MAPDWSRLFGRRPRGAEPHALRLSCFDLDWTLATPDAVSLALERASRAVRGPFCPGCGRHLEKRGRAFGGTPWHTVENPCAKCGRRASHPELSHTVAALKRGVLAEAQRRAREGR